jgi:uncharacterized protein (TIGR02145 family)
MNSTRFIVYAAFSAMCLWPLTLPAQNGITVSDFAMKAGTVTFNVSWNKNNMPKEWSDTAWVFVDYSDNGAMKRLPLATGATLTATSAPGVGKVIPASNNNKGVWLIGNARTAGAFSATVRLLTAAANLSGMCVYAINYPPVGWYTSNTTIAFKGTPKYVVNLDNNQSVTVTNPYTIPKGRAIVSFTDASGAPGIIKCTPPVIRTLRATAEGFCMEVGSVQFALSGTDKGAPYRLFKDGVATDVTLTGNGSAATFSQEITAKGTYTVRVEAGAYCPAEMDGRLNIKAYFVPDKPSVTSASRCGPGAVELQASSAGADVDWYASYTGGTPFFKGQNKYTPTLSESSIYFVQARTANGCVSAERAIVLAIVNDIPANPSGKSASRCGPGTVMLRASSPDAMIDWYDTATGGSPLLSGNNSYTTPSISTNITYYTQARIEATGCVSAARVPLLAKVNPLPANPSGESASRCGPGTVMLQASSPDAMIDWYDTATGGSPLFSGNNSYTTPSISTNITYYTQARIAATGCVSAARQAISATIKPIPTVTRSGGAANQTVRQNMPIEDIWYKGYRIKSMKNSENFPPKLITNINGPILTISGTPSIPGTFSYTVTATNTEGCESDPASGVILVLPVPTGAASTQTWKIGNQLWSAPIMKRPKDCMATTDFKQSNPPVNAYYRLSKLYSGSGYLYNWKCVIDVAQQLCDNGWRVPTKDDFVALDKALGGTGGKQSQGASKVVANYINVWGGVYGGYIKAAELVYSGASAYYWSSTERETTSAYSLQFGGDYIDPQYYNSKSYGFQVRCVK